jgi:hypothetical protein
MITENPLRQGGAAYLPGKLFPLQKNSVSFVLDELGQWHAATSARASFDFRIHNLPRPCQAECFSECSGFPAMMNHAVSLSQFRWRRTSPGKNRPLWHKHQLFTGAGRTLGGSDHRGTVCPGRGRVIIIEQERDERLAHVLLDVVGEHAQKVSAHTLFEAVVNGAEL